MFGFVFITFLPGYCLINIIFTGKNRIDSVEQLVLSVALSFGLDGLIGLFLGLSSIGISFNSLAISLGTVILALASVALVIKLRQLPIAQMQTPQQISA